MGRTFRSNWNAAAFYTALLVVAFLILFPLYWVFKMSVVSRSELNDAPPTFWPHTFSWSNYTTIFHDSHFTNGLVNSAVIAGFTTVICLVVGSVAAYALARIRFALRVPTLTLILAIAFFPTV